MTKSISQALQKDIDVLVTHALPHPSLATFRVGEQKEEYRELERLSGVPFICNPGFDQEEAIKEGKKSPEEFREGWNKKSFLMGSNILEHETADFKDGIIVLYGHNHR